MFWFRLESACTGRDDEIFCGIASWLSIQMNSDYEISRERLSRELESFKHQLKVAKGAFEKERLKATIQGTEMMLAVIPRAQAAE